MRSWRKREPEPDPEPDVIDLDAVYVERATEALRVIDLCDFMDQSDDEIVKRALEALRQ